METITIRDVAKICGVGVSTVSRAINNHPDINPETKDMILKVIKENNYIPNNSARNLKRTDAKAIAVLVKGITNPFFSSMIKIMEEEIQRRKYTLVLHHVEYNEDEVEVALQLIKEKRLRGIVFLGGHFCHSEEELGLLEAPFVLSTIGMMPNAISRSAFSSVSVDDEKESARLIDYLISLGHRDIAIITARPDDVSIGKLRFLGYRKALEAHGIRFREELVGEMKAEWEDYSIKNGYEVMKELMERNISFTAVYAISDTMAIGALRALCEAGFRIPEDYSVVGFDGLDVGRYMMPSLTTMEQPVEEMAMETIRILFDIIRGNAPHQHRIFPGKLTERESSGKPPLKT